MFRRDLQVILLSVIVAAACTQRTPHAPRQETLVLAGARVYASPTAAPIDDALVIVQDGRIIAVGPRQKYQPAPGAHVIDGRGKVLTAGFWNTHVHFIEALARVCIGTFGRPRRAPAADAHTTRLHVGRCAMSLADLKCRPTSNPTRRNPESEYLGDGSRAARASRCWRRRRPISIAGKRTGQPCAPSFVRAASCSSCCPYVDEPGP